MLIPLHVKSHYSLGCGTTPVARLVERAAMLGLPAMGLTDTENLYGQVTFHRRARERGLRPITGVELRGAAPSCSRAGSPRRCRLVLLARDRAGYESLCRIVTRRRLHEDEDRERSGTAGIDPVESIRGHLDGLFLLVEDLHALTRVLSLPGVDRDTVRLLLVRPGGSVTAEDELLAASRRLSIPLVADPDIVFLDPGDRLLHGLQVAIGRNTLLSRIEEEGLLPPIGRHFPGPRECEGLFRDVPEAVEETRRLAGQCELDLRRRRPIFPRLDLPEGETPYSHLVKIAFRGLEGRFPRISSRHMERLVTELQVIEQLGFCEYFVVVGDIVRFARERRIEVVGRGSGAGSLVAHVLGITNVDPVEYGLYFERFLHPGRTDLPDIDVDLCWIRRDEVIDYVYRTYGRERVAMISSHVTFQPHMAFRETIKAFGVPIEEVNRLSRKLPYLYPALSPDAPLVELIRSSMGSRDLPLEEEPFRTAIPLAERLLNQPHHLSIHPGGIVIADRDIDTYVSLERAAKGIVVTQYDMYSIEEVGLVKIDLLGNRCLTELQETLELISREPSGDSDDSAKPASGRATRLALRDIPDADPPTVELLGSARTLGCFQLESPAMRSLLAKLRTRNIRDCIAAVAIIRPGAAAGGAKEAFVRRRNGEEMPEYLHPSLRRLLEESHGIVIYEEDVMCIASAIAGISLAEGDRLRSALKKARHPDDARDLENDFVRRAVQNGIEPDVAGAVWRDLRRFSAYCFSKAHAAGYGVLAYQSAYLKARFPVEFGCAILNNHAGMYSTRTLAEEVKRNGVTILHPSVNRSEVRFTIERQAGSTAPSRAPGIPSRAILTGLGRVKGLSTDSCEAIRSARRSGGPFRSFTDFLGRVSLPRREVEALILAGAFDGLPPPPGGSSPPNHPQLLWELHSSGRPSPPGRRPREPAVPPEDPPDLIPGTFPPRGLRPKESADAPEQQGILDLVGDSPDYPPLEPYDTMTRIRNEIEILEMGITDHPMRLLRDEARRRGCLPIGNAALRVGKRVRVAGILAATRKIRTAKGRWMQFLTLEDEEGLIEATLFPRVWEAFSSRIRTLGPYIIEGKIEVDHGAVNLTVSRLEPWPTSPGARVSGVLPVDSAGAAP